MTIPMNIELDMHDIERFTGAVAAFCMASGYNAENQRRAMLQMAPAYNDADFAALVTQYNLEPPTIEELLGNEIHHFEAHKAAVSARIDELVVKEFAEANDIMRAQQAATCESL